MIIVIIFKRGLYGDSSPWMELVRNSTLRTHISWKKQALRETPTHSSHVVRLRPNVRVCVCVCARWSQTTCGALLWTIRQLRGHTGSIRGGSEWHGGIFLSHNYKLYIPVTHVSVNSLCATNPPADVTDPSHDAKDPDRHLPRCSLATCKYDAFAASKIPGGDVY